jgi:glycosyltransferase involved in cell wall biosynthesis
MVVDPESAEEMAVGLNKLIGDEELRSRLAERGLARAKSYTWERAVHATHSVYEELVKF